MKRREKIHCLGDICSATRFLFYVHKNEHYIYKYLKNNKVLPRYVSYEPSVFPASAFLLLPRQCHSLSSSGCLIFILLFFCLLKISCLQSRLFVFRFISSSLPSWFSLPIVSCCKYALLAFFHF